MAKDIPSKKYKGVYYRELQGGDRSYFLILRIDGKQKRIKIGKKSEGITEAFCYQQKVHIINSDRFGEDQAAILQKTKKKDPTFLEIAQDYSKHGSARDNTKRLILYLANMVPFKDQRKVTERDVTQWLTEYRKQVKPGTINNKINLLRIVFKHGIDQKLYRFDNPMTNIQKTKVDDKRLRWLSKDEIDLLLSELKDKPNLYLFTKLALVTGGRISTLVRIHKRDIRGDQIKLYNVKTGRNYIGFLDKETQELLESRTGYVLSWGSPDEMPDVQQYQWRMLRVLNKLFNEGVTEAADRVVVHTLRHTAASLLVQNKTPLHIVQKVLDHQSIRSTERYAKLHQDNIKTELDRLWSN
ncbi:integrase family site specific recombinase [Vibrio phage X29]|uniref:integrase family site specific recombinase n=1 Tax=Vibrio phage X29 TaxID=1500713 RepID=UPI00045FDFA0|nr:integrase family site specific recombinase [Vibrio phage X29]AIA10310.1 integrase family site specific recombinase [Vibrio phage X29]